MRMRGLVAVMAVLALPLGGCALGAAGAGGYALGSGSDTPASRAYTEFELMVKRSEVSRKKDGNVWVYHLDRLETKEGVFECTIHEGVETSSRLQNIANGAEALQRSSSCEPVE